MPQTGVASRAALAAAFPAVAKAALADDLADDSFGERLLGKLKGLVSLRRVGADVQGDAVEAKLARAEAALDAGDLAKAVELVKSLPPQTAKATAGLAGPRRGPSRGQARGRPARRPCRHPARRGAVDPMTMLRILIWFAVAAVAMLGAVWLAERPGTRHRRVAGLAARHQRRRACWSPSWC